MKLVPTDPAAATPASSSNADLLSGGDLDLSSLALAETLPVRSVCGFAIPFAIRSKSNFRAGRRQGATWAKLAGFEDSVASLARAARPATWPDLDDTVPLAERPQVALVIYASGLVDPANLSKSVADALEGVLYLNDASVRSVVSFAHRSGRAKHGAVLAAVLDADAPLEQVVSASAQLAAWFAAQVGEPTPR